MAQPNPRALDRGSIEALVSEGGGIASPSLKVLWLPLFQEDGSVETVVVCHLVFIRAGGFMVLLPAHDEAFRFLEAIAGLADDLVEPPAFHSVSVSLTTARGRALGSVDAELVDVPWAGAECFAQSMPVRYSEIIISLASSSLRSVSSGWRSGQARCSVSPSSGERLDCPVNDRRHRHRVPDCDGRSFRGATGEEAHPSVDGEPVEDGRVQLLARIAALEAQLRQGNRVPLLPRTRPAPPPTAIPPSAAGRGRPLFQDPGSGGQMSAQD